MKKSSILLIALFSVFLILSTLSSAEAKEQDKPCVYYFYGIGCTYCAKTSPYMELLEQNNTIELHKFEVYNNQTNAALMRDFFDYHNVSREYRGVPVVFVADTYLLGYSNINLNLEEEIKAHPNAECPSLKPSEPNNNQTSFHTFSLSTLVTVAGAALVDSVNPCAIAVLLILMTSLFILGNPKVALKSGFAFILALYIMYFLFGIGLLAVFKEFVLILGAKAFANISSIVKIIVGIFAILIGLANIKDFFWYGGAGFIMEIPIKWRPSMKKLLGRVVSPAGAFIAGLIVSAFELPCTGGPYFFVMGYLADKVTYSSVIPLLLIYNLVFVLPLIILSLLLYFGLTSVERAEHWRQSNLRTLHLITGLVMLALGILVVAGLI